MVQPLDLPRNEAGIAAAVAVLKQRFGDRFHTSDAMRAQHAHTTTWIKPQPPDAVVFAESTAEVADIVRVCASHRVPVIPFGIGSSLEGHVNAPAGGICIDTSMMNRILAIHPEDLDCVVQPGVSRAQLNTELRTTGLFFPIDPGANATIGGMAATRASGTNAVRYGTMKENVLALEVVMAQGQVIRTAARARKSSAGYDLTRLILGSEGSLGVITEITLRLQGIPEAISAARCSFPSITAACQAVIEVVQYGIAVARIELLDALQVQACNAYSHLDLPETPLLLLEFHGSPAAVAAQAEAFGAIAADNGGDNFTWAGQAEERNKLWQARHDAYWAGLQLRPGAQGIATDVCVPISRLAECVGAAQERLAQMNLLAPVVGHVGDGNFHTLLLIDMQDNEEIARAEAFVGWLNDLAIAMEGTCTGEHGIGQGKQPWLERELGGAVEVMATIKQALDPANILNPGKIFAQRGCHSGEGCQ